MMTTVNPRLGVRFQCGCRVSLEITWSINGVEALIEVIVFIEKFLYDLGDQDVIIAWGPMMEFLLFLPREFGMIPKQGPRFCREIVASPHLSNGKLTGMVPR